MFLKNLTIKGFKSFADTADLGLEPGVTVVVGPNGSGKSNVVDAIAWVLGAQAPSAIRSQKMDDVIFAGTDKKAALGRAEVSLTIDNSSGMLPIEFSEVTINRTLFRSGDSEYSINGVPCRLLDIADLLSDSGVGRTQHVIISQGQIDAVLNAKATDRRMIIEEAAGVLKYRKRKEKAERRLNATEANLTRVQDLLREVRRGLRPLERQADAARRHGALIDELGALRKFLAGRELSQLRTRLENTTRDRAGHGERDEALRSRLAELNTAVLKAEAELNAIGGTDLGDELTRFEALRERGRGIAAVLQERERSLAKERESSVDAELIASLESDQANLRSALESMDAAATTLLPDADEVGRAEAGLAEARAQFEERWGEGVAGSSGEAAEVRGELAGLRNSVQRALAELDRFDGRNRSLSDKRARLVSEVDRLREEIAAADSALPSLESDQERLATEHTAAEAALEAASSELADAEADRRSWIARADALAEALDAARSAAGAERLAEIDGVIGTLLDLVEVDAGWEAAFEAAASDALAAVVVDGPEAARAAFTSLVNGDATGAVLALGVDRPTTSPPPMGEPVRGHVRSNRPDVEDLLDAVIGSAVVVDGNWPAGLDVALSHPDAVVVTNDGARFGPGSWRIGNAATGATGAALEEALARVDASVGEVAVAAEARDGARSHLGEAKAAATAARQAAEKTAATRRRAAEALERGERELAEATKDLGGQSDERSELETRIETERARVAELEAALPALEAEEAAAAEAAKAMADARDALDERASAVVALRSDLEVRAAQIEERQTSLRNRLAEVDSRLERNQAAAAEAAERREALEGKATALAGLIRACSASLAKAEERLVVLREERKAQSEAQRSVSSALDGLRRERAAAEKELGEVRERVQRADIDLNEVNLRIETSVETMRRDLGISPDEALAAECPELPETTSPAARTRELERELRLMGPINPLALEEYEQLQERHEFLQAQLDDVKGSRRELSKVIKAVDEEIVNVFAAAFADVSQNFTQLFSTLFPGGEGSLKLTDPENLLETGIELSAKPSGKNVKKLSLLSGGERSLTALAYLFAVFRSRPSPFYVMDEVEAALDDVNLHRFLDLVAEFRNEAQLVIVSHQKRTMEAADVLYGVTMSPGGSSKVVSEKGAAAVGAN
ncbi:chromosome segregation protein SMC [Actinospongicola halichondriae]|uniref:chromosome segregation protein SMC n=1 Tax=Actinospongicola halichondriae TaxID=3236844 RepID=UPI003D4CEF79